MWNSLRLNESLKEESKTALPHMAQRLEATASRRSMPVMAVMADSSSGALAVGIGFQFIIFYAVSVLACVIGLSFGSYLRATHLVFCDLAIDFVDGAGEIVRESLSVHRCRVGGDEAVALLGEVVTAKLVVHGDDSLNLKGEPRRVSHDAVAHVHHRPAEFIPSGTLLLKLGLEKGDCIKVFLHR